jgi:hypothetical protein
MIRLFGFRSACVKLLTLALLAVLTSCSLIKHYAVDTCNSRAYVRTVMSDYISSRYHMNAQVRLAVIPFSVPANVAGQNNEVPGIGNELAWKVQEHFIDSSVFPITEVLNRQDWPGKKEEFHTGNFGAIRSARDAGYDLVFVGKLEPMNSLDSMSATTKLIETESGMTLWSGQTRVRSDARSMDSSLDSWGISERIPAKVDINGMKEDLARCIVREVVSEKVN